MANRPEMVAPTNRRHSNQTESEMLNRLKRVPKGMSKKQHYAYHRICLKAFLSFGCQRMRVKRFVEHSCYGLQSQQLYCCYSWHNNIWLTCVHCDSHVERKHCGLCEAHNKYRCKLEFRFFFKFFSFLFWFTIF